MTPYDFVLMIKFGNYFFGRWGVGDEIYHIGYTLSSDVVLYGS